MNLPDLTFMRPWAWWLLLLVPLVLLASAIIAGRPRAPRWPTALRGMTLILLIATVSGPLLVTGTSSATTIFVVDRSASISQGPSEAANQWIADALASTGVDDSAAVITFGAEPDLAVPSVPPVRWATSGSRPWPAVDTTDLASALSLARSLSRLATTGRSWCSPTALKTPGTRWSRPTRRRTTASRSSSVPLAGVDAAELRIEQVTGPDIAVAGR